MGLLPPPESSVLLFRFVVDVIAVVVVVSAPLSTFVAVSAGERERAIS